MIDRRPKPIATTFPPDVRDALVRAAQIRDQLERTAAIERVTEAARSLYPELFRRPRE